MSPLVLAPPICKQRKGHAVYLTCAHIAGLSISHSDFVREWTETSAKQSRIQNAACPSRYQCPPYDQECPNPLFISMSRSLCVLVLLANGKLNKVR